MPLGQPDSVFGPLASIPANHQGQRSDRSDGLPAVHNPADFKSAETVPLLLILVQEHGDGLYVCQEATAALRRRGLCLLQAHADV